MESNLTYGPETQFIAEYLREVLSVTELCELYAISRKTGYKWIERYLRQGPAGLEERSRVPRSSPNQTPAEIVTAILEARRRQPMSPDAFVTYLPGRSRRPAAGLFAAARDRHHRVSPRPLGGDCDRVEVAPVAW